MGRSLAIALLAIACAAAPGRAADAAEDLALDDYDGDWIGSLELSGVSLSLVLHVDADAVPPATLDSPDQGAFGIAAVESAEEAVREGELSLSWPDLGATYVGRLAADGERIDGEFAQRGTAFALDLVRADAADLAPPARPQEPVPPLPYGEAPVSVEVPGEGVTLAGTLTLPPGDGPFPGVVLVSGSGAQDRDESVMGHRPFLVLSDRLARAGIAALRHDDRGTGASTGTFDGATSRDFAADAAAALAALAAREEIGPVGFVGHSEGALVAALAVAERGAEADFLVALAGPFVPLAKVVRGQVEDALRLAGTDAAVAEESLRVQDRILEAALLDGTEEEVCEAVDAATERLPEATRREASLLCRPWFRTALRLDPVALHRAANVPTLALFGALDRQVAAGPNARAARGLPGVEVRVIDGANHLFQGAGTGAVSEYRGIEETMREGVMEGVATWIRAR